MKFGIYIHFYGESPVGASETQEILIKQVTISADNVAMLHSTVHLLSCVYLICLLSDTTNNTDTIRMVPVYNNSQ